MAGPHQDNGVPWTISTPTVTPTPAPVSTGTPKFGGQGTGGANQSPPPNNPREEAIMAASTANMPIPIPSVTQTQTGGDFGGYETAQQQAAASMMDAGQVAGNLAFGLYDKSPVQYPDDVTIDQIINTDDPAEIGGFQHDLPENVYYSPYGPETQAYAHGSNPYDDQLIGDTGYVEIEPGEGVPGYTRDENGNLVWLGLEGASRYHGWNPWESGSQGPGGGQQFFDPGYYDPRQETLDKLRFLQAGLPQKVMEQQGFFGEMEEAYQPDIDEALDKGIFSGAMRQGLFDPKGLRRLISSYGSGVAQPRYTNVARGGIVSLVGE